MTASDLLEQPCNKSDIAIKLACYKLLTACSKLVTTTGNKQCEHNLSTTCEQISSNLFADLQERVRFYVCTVSFPSIFLLKLNLNYQIHEQIKRFLIYSISSSQFDSSKLFLLQFQ